MKDQDLKTYRMEKSFNQFKCKESNRFEFQRDRSKKILKQAISGNLVPPLYLSVIQKVSKALFEETGDFNIDQYAAEELAGLEDHNVIRYLYHRYRYVVYPRNYIVDEYPPCLQIEPASKCNFRCTFCYQADKTFSENKSGYMGIMSLDCFKKVIDDIEGKVDIVTLASRGEPLLAKDFLEMMDYIKGKFLSFKINTNASLLRDKQAHAILSAGVNTLVFSADAANEEDYKDFRVNGSLDKTVKNIKRFQEIKNTDYPDSKIVTRVSGVLVDPKRQDIHQMERFWGEHVDQVSFVNCSPVNQIYYAPENDIVEPCSDLWRRMFVWYDGSVSPCDNDYKTKLKVGTIYESDISSLWSCKAYSELRKGHEEKKRSCFEPCKRCIIS